ncbi:MAG: dCTP deaminase [Candidatus Colwellbacteria bacterium]
MSVLIKDQILERIKNGSLAFNPGLDALQVQGHSVDLRLGFTFMIPKVWQATDGGREAVNLDPLRSVGSSHFDVVELEQGQHFDLLPSEFILVSSLESITIPKDLMAVLYPRSSVNRRGLSIDLTGIIDSGYSGKLVLPVRNNTRSQTIRLYPGERFCQLVFQQLLGDVDTRRSRHHMRDVAEGLAKEDDQEVDIVIKGDIDALKDKYPLE